MGLAGVLLGLALLVWLAFRGWTVLLLAPAAALLAASFAGEPLLAHWTQTFMGSAAQFLAQFFPLFLMGALFGILGVLFADPILASLKVVLVDLSRQQAAAKGEPPEVV